MTKAIGLLSGGLDSILAVKVIQEQEIEVTGLSFVTPFFGPHLAQKAAKQLNIPLIVKDITPEHLEIVKHPRYGYGNTMNPCIDCHALMLKVAGRIMEEHKFDFIFTGEVLDERPMSQNKKSLQRVAAMSGYGAYTLRPLSAKLLVITEPEKQKMVEREKLLDIRGRSRKRQIEMAQSYGIKEFPNPAGGCLLTDAGFSKRLKELLAHEEDPTIRDLELLKIGRHFRLGPKTKLIVGRNSKDNETIRAMRTPEDGLLFAEDVSGPTCLLVREKTQEIIQNAVQICAAYSDTPNGNICTITIKEKNQTHKINIEVDKSLRDKGKIL